MTCSFNTQLTVTAAFVGAFLYFGACAVFGWLLRANYGTDSFTTIAVAFGITTILFLAAIPCTIWFVMYYCPGKEMPAPDVEETGAEA
jgi:hypothetical protein